MISRTGQTVIEPDLSVPAENRQVAERSKRLREAVKAAGGNQAVADRAGILVGTLNRYLAGRDMKASAMTALADACNVSIEWLATGRGSMHPSNHPPPETPVQPKLLPLFGSVDMETMAQAMEVVSTVFRMRGTAPTWRRRAQITMLIYDMLREPEADLSQVQRVLSEASADDGNT